MAETWQQRRLRAAISIGGQVLSCMAQDIEESAIEPAGALVPAADGRTSYQTRAVVEGPLSARQSIQLTLVVTSEDDYMLARSLLARSSAAPLMLWMDVPLVETWLIATSRTEWTMRRATAFDSQAIATYEPRVFVGSAELTRSATSPPGAGEYYVDPAASSAVLETADLLASAGQWLEIRYHPWRPLGLVEVGFSHADEDNGLWEIDLAAEEHLE